MAEPDDAPPPKSGGGGGISKKVLHVPIWGWALGIGALGGLVWFWRRNKSSSTTDSTTADSSAAGSSDTNPTSLVPINQGLSEDQTQSILDAIKKLHGPPSDDDDDDDGPGTPTTLPGQVKNPPPKPPKAPTPPKDTKPKTVTVVKWTKTNTPWDSTLWGIANHEHVKGGWQYLQKINHISGDPKKALKPGMKIKLSA
jgi:hypothetical protein